MYSDYPKAESKRGLLEMTSSALSICECICCMKHRVNRTTAKGSFTMKATLQREKPSWQLTVLPAHHISEGCHARVTHT